MRDCISVPGGIVTTGLLIQCLTGDDETRTANETSRNDNVDIGKVLNLIC